MASITFKDEGSNFEMMTPRKYRNDPATAWTHRMKARAHVDFLQSNKFLNVEKAPWGMTTYEGQDWYHHTYEGNTLLITVRSKDGQHKLNHSNNAALENFLKDTPEQDTIFELRYVDDGTDYISTCQMSALAVGLTSVGLVIAGVALFATAALGTFEVTSEIGIAIGAAVLEATGVELNVVLPGIGVVLIVLALIGLWIAYAIGRNISLNLTFENRSKQNLKIVDYMLYNLPADHFKDRKFEDIKKPGGMPMLGLHESVKGGIPVDSYDTFDVALVNYSKYKGVGLAFKFTDAANNPFTVAFRNDIYYEGHFLVGTGDNPALVQSAQSAYDNAGQAYPGAVSVPWYDGQKKAKGYIRLNLDAAGFHEYKFAGIISFHDEP